MPERLQDLDDYYVIQLGNVERITGRPAQRVIVKPVDQYRYGYHLWADKETGLLLKAVDADPANPEAFMNLCALWERLQETEKAIGACRGAASRSPGTTWSITARRP